MVEKEFYTLSEVIQIFQLEERLIVDLEREDIICPACRAGSKAKLFSVEDMEKLRFAKTLLEDMGVNLAGVEVILRMRQNMEEMRRQFDAILEDFSRHLKATMRDKP